MKLGNQDGLLFPLHFWVVFFSLQSLGNLQVVSTDLVAAGCCSLRDIVFQWSILPMVELVFDNRRMSALEWTRHFRLFAVLDDEDNGLIETLQR